MGLEMASWVRFFDCNWFEMRGLSGKFGFGLTSHFLAFVPPFFIALYGVFHAAPTYYD